MCRNAHRSLRAGGEFFVLNQSPDFRFDGPSPRQYGFLTELTGEETETGPRVKITALLDPPSRSSPTSRAGRSTRSACGRPDSAR